jgi:oligo-1,6-glucosidase
MKKVISPVAILILATLFAHAQSNKSADNSFTDRKWWKEALVYQIYPRSFNDSDGDGVGDLRGIIAKLDYIKSLGVDVVWLNPVYSSPNADNGYDISNYKEIMKEFGTMRDFDSLVVGLHRRNIKLVMDLVVNHSSDEHEWFQQARSSRTNPYRNYYHWWPAENGIPPKRFSFFDVHNNAWQYDSTTNAYYLHYFSVKQPDLNWENPQLRQEVYKIMKFWLDKGVNGFRMDAISYISKDTSFPDLAFPNLSDFIPYYAKGPHLHDYLQEMNREVLSKYDLLTVAETSGAGPEDAQRYIDPERKELNMLYHFEGMNLGLHYGEITETDPDGYKLIAFKALYSRWDSIYNRKGWGTIYLGNHDQPRMLSRWGNDSIAYRSLSSKMLTTFLLTMHATPYYYAGDEIGMANIKFDDINDYRDIETLNNYKRLKGAGADVTKFLNYQKKIARDNGRTPFQWNSTWNAGFTSGTPWIKVNPDYKITNVSDEEKEPNSVLNYFKRMVKLRKENPVLIYGKYRLLDNDNADVYAYTRELNGDKILVLLNFKSKISIANTGIDLKKAKVLQGNYINPSKDGKLRPYEAVLYQLSSTAQK